MNSDSTNPPLPGSSEPVNNQAISKTVPPALQALLSLSEGDSDQIKTILSPAFARLLVKYLDSDPSEALVIMNNLVTSNVGEIKVVLKAPDSMKKLLGLLEHQDNDIRKQVCEILSKITSRSSLLGYVLENPVYLEKIKKIVSNENSENRKEAAKILFNAAMCAHISQVIVLSEHGVLECLHALTKQEADKELHEFGRVGVLNCAKTYNECVEGIFASVSIGPKKSKCHGHCKKKTVKKIRK